MEISMRQKPPAFLLYLLPMDLVLSLLLIIPSNAPKNFLRFSKFNGDAVWSNASSNISIPEKISREENTRHYTHRQQEHPYLSAHILFLHFYRAY